MTTTITPATDQSNPPKSAMSTTAEPASAQVSGVPAEAAPTATTGATQAHRGSRASSSSSASPARGIAMGAVLSAPMWIGILYLVRLVANSL